MTKMKITKISINKIGPISFPDKTEILKSLQNMPSSCKEVNFTLFGLSLSGLNFLSSLIVAIYCIRTLVYEKN